MKECPREPEVLEYIAAGSWPDAVSEELRRHAETCAVCSDLAVTAHAIVQDHTAALRAATPPPAGLVWWRAELRARQEAVRAASRPMTLVQALACASALGAAVGLLTGFDLAPLSALLSENRVIFYAALAAAALIAPFALYLVFSDD